MTHLLRDPSQPDAAKERGFDQVRIFHTKITEGLRTSERAEGLADLACREVINPLLRSDWQSIPMVYR